MKTSLLLTSVFCLLTPALAVKTERWEVQTPADFMRGKLQRLTVASDGELRLGYNASKLGEFAKEIWCSTVAPDGTIYFGTGSPADVYAIGKDRQAVRIATTDAVAVTSLACDAQGNLYAGTLPDGKIFKITPDKKSSDYCRLRSPYVWALALDKNGVLFAGTGADGKIYRIGADAKPEEWYTAEDSNILCLAFDPADGSLLAGGSDRGLLYRVTAKGKGSVLHEFAEDEVKAILVSGQDLFVAVNKQKVRRPRAPVPGQRPSAGEFEALGAQLTAQYGAPAATRTTGRETPPETRMANLLAGALYQRQANGRVDRWAYWDNESIHAIARDAEGGILLAMAGAGRVFRVPDGQHWELLFDFDEKQALTLAVHNGRLAFVGMGNIGNAYLIDAQKSANGEYTSEARDCRFLATWGKLDWRAEGAVTVATRTGNTALPDKTWSTWSQPLTKAPAAISSPRGRYIQLRATLARQSEPCLRSLTLHLQVQNQKPEISALETGEKPKTNVVTTAGAPAAPAPEQFRPKPASTIKRLSWRASDKDGDTLLYRLYYRAEGDEVWIPMLQGRTLRATEHSWDTDSIPDAWYRVKVTASDEECNPVGEALIAERISHSIKVNNARPIVSDLKFDAGMLRGVARSKLSLIRFLEYSVDGAEWKFFAPADGVFDDREEIFGVKLPLAAGPHTIAVRATDEDGNAGVERIAIRVP
ncbi:MAG: hypothetical protein FJ395_01710 [Verrucomicrobia bacterium]|nr:hypothetical protein [Verrucomicrobiota bacterium]